MKLVRTVCDPNCHASPRCGITAHVTDGRISKIEPGPFPLPQYDRRICAMGMARLEQQYHKDRLRYPLKRSRARGAGAWQRIAWGEAFELLAERLGAISEKFGPRSLAFFAGSGAAGVLTRGSVQRFAADGAAGLPRRRRRLWRAEGARIRSACRLRPTRLSGHEFVDAVNSP
jgi:anaerobic selenocysteine-containing dehydrogenase